MLLLAARPVIGAELLSRYAEPPPNNSATLYATKVMRSRPLFSGRGDACIRPEGREGLLPSRRRITVELQGPLFFRG